MSNVQFSNHIRAHSQRECNGHLFSPGQLRAFDLAAFAPRTHASDGLGIPSRILAAVEQHPHEELILYRLANLNTAGSPDVHGWVLTPAGAGGVHAVVRTHETVSRSHQGAAVSARVMDQAVAVFSHAHVPGSAEVLLDLVKGEVLEVNPQVQRLGGHASKLVPSQ